MISYPFLLRATGLIVVVVVVVVVVGRLDRAGLAVGDGCGWPVGLATAGVVVMGMLEPPGMDVGDAVGAVVAALVVAWTAELAAGVDGVLEQAADRLASTSAGSSRRVWWRLMAISRVRGWLGSGWPGSEQVGVGDDVVVVVASASVEGAPAGDQAQL